MHNEIAHAIRHVTNQTLANASIAVIMFAPTLAFAESIYLGPREIKNGICHVISPSNKKNIKPVIEVFAVCKTGNTKLTLTPGTSDFLVKASYDAGYFSADDYYIVLSNLLAYAIPKAYGTSYKSTITSGPPITYDVTTKTFFFEHFSFVKKGNSYEVHASGHVE